jgi:alkyl sulfatase BDS1-like metallo-beta-lactamase superfamily hydrolase
VLRTEHGVLHFREQPAAPHAQATLRLTRAFFVRMMTGEAGALALLTSPETAIEGSRIALARFFGLFDRAPGAFPIVTR